MSLSEPISNWVSDEHLDTDWEDAPTTPATWPLPPLSHKRPRPNRHVTGMLEDRVRVQSNISCFPYVGDKVSGLVLAWYLIVEVWGFQQHVLLVSQYKIFIVGG